MIVAFLICALSVCFAAIAFYWPPFKSEGENRRIGNFSLWLARIILGVWAALCCVPYPNMVLLAGLLLFTGMILSFNRKRMLPVFASMSFLYVVTALFLLGSYGRQGWNEAAQMIPKVELPQRLDYEYQQPITLKSSKEKIGSEARERLNSLETALAEVEESYSRSYMPMLQMKSLQLTHASHVEHFVNSPGFGANRSLRPQPYQAIDYIEKTRQQLGEPVRQSTQSLPTYPPLRSNKNRLNSINNSQDSIESSVADAGDSQQVTSSALNNSGHLRVHDGAQKQFASPDHYGYVQPNEYAVGFFSHRLVKNPGINSLSRYVPRIELVSLLKQKIPAVYVSEFLPNMEELADNPTRPLTEFETTALARLKQGEDIVVDNPANPTYMLGSLRAARQCLQCHAVERGVLLGAFSYQLRKDPPRSEPIDKKSL